MKTQDLLIIAGVGVVGYLIYTQMKKKQGESQGSSDSSDSSTDSSSTTNSTNAQGLTWIDLAKKDKNVFNKVKALQSGLNIILTQMGKKAIAEDGYLGTQTQKAIQDVFGNHYGELKAGDIMTLDFFNKQLAQKNALKKNDSRFLSNAWWGELWK